MTRWSEDEEHYMDSSYKSLGPKKIALHLGRSHKAVREKARRMGLATPYPVYKNPDPIITKLVSARHKAGLTQGDVGRVFDISAAAVSSWEMGRVSPSLRRVLNWAAALDLELRLVRRRF